MLPSVPIEFQRCFFSQHLSLFGRKNSKIEFDARQPPQEILQRPQAFSYVHNLKVHFKSSGLPMLANKIDVSVTTDSPSLPSPQLVSDEFNKRMVMSNAHTNNRVRFNPSSFHITNIEYKESSGSELLLIS